MTKEILNYTIFNCTAGWIGVLSSARGLLRLTLPQPSAEQAKQLLGEDVNRANHSPHLFTDLIERLRNYFAGSKTDFTDELDLCQASDFQRKVWEATQRIPHGETRSYAWVAEQAGKPKAARAVGQALARNPLPIIVPCHRVLTSNDKLGGFTGGLRIKEYLLSLEARGKAG